MTRAIPVLLLLTLTSLAVAAEEDQDAHDHDAHQSQETTEGHDDRGSHDDHGHGEGAVHLDDALIAELGLTVAPAGAGEISHRVHVPGEVRPNRNRLAHLVPRFGGVVAEVRAFEGDRVAAGDVLARVEANESLVEFDVRSLIAGTVIERHATLGEAVSPDRNMFVVADLDTLWVELAIPQRDLGSIRVGQTVRLRVGHDVQPDAARIDYLAPVVDAVTRTGTARVVVANPDGIGQNARAIGQLNQRLGSDSRRRLVSGRFVGEWRAPMLR